MQRKFQKRARNGVYEMTGDGAGEKTWDFQKRACWFQL